MWHINFVTFIVGRIRTTRKITMIRIPSSTTVTTITMMATAQGGKVDLFVPNQRKKTFEGLDYLKQYTCVLVKFPSITAISIPLFDAVTTKQ